MSSETLSILQSNNFYWRILISEWIRYLANNYVNFVNFIRNKFPEMRQTSHLSEPRLRNALIHNILTAQIFMSFLQNNQIVDENYVDQFMNQFSTIMSTLVENQGNDSKQRAIHLMFASELRNLRGNGNIIIAPTLDDYIQRLREYSGYEDSKSHIFLKKDNIFRIISDSYRNRGEYFPTSANELPKILYENNMTEVNTGSFTVKASSLIEGRPPMTCLIKEAYEKILEELID